MISLARNLRRLRVSGETLMACEGNFAHARSYLVQSSSSSISRPISGSSNPINSPVCSRMRPHSQNRKSDYTSADFGHKKRECANMCTSAVLSTSSSEVEDEPGCSGIEIDDAQFELTVEEEVYDDLAHLRLKLYDGEDESVQGIKKYLEQIQDAASIQQIIDVVEEHERIEGKLDLKVASQALVTLWDLQKFIFKLTPTFDPERDFFDRTSFIEKLASHAVVKNKIIKTIVEGWSELADEALTACMFCMKRLNYDMRSVELESCIDECLRRKDTLALSSLSRVAVCLRDENNYGAGVIGKFHPLLLKYIDSMSSDEEVRLAAIALRSSIRVSTKAMMERFIARINSLKDEFPKWENVTLCKVFLVLLFMRNHHSEGRQLFDVVGEALIPRVPTLQLMDLFTLQKFLDLNVNQPFGLVEALVQRMLSIIQEAVSTSGIPRLDLLAAIAPFLKGVEQRCQMALMLREYLDTQVFELASGILFTILRWSRTNNFALCDEFWKQAEKMTLEREASNVLDKRLIRMGKEYISFIYGLGLSYRNRSFERTLKRYLYNLIDNYREGKRPCLINPGDMAKAFSFLIGTAQPGDRILNDISLLEMLDDFALQFRASDLGVVSRGLEVAMQNAWKSPNNTPKYSRRILDMCSIVEEQGTRFLLDSESGRNLVDLLTIHKVALMSRRLRGDTPLIEQSLRRIMQGEIDDARAVKDISQCLLIGANNFPETNQAMFEVLWKCRDTPLNPEALEKFVCAIFTVGFELVEDLHYDVIELCSKRLTRHWNKLTFLGLLQSSLALCYYNELPKELVQNIFSVEFLDEIDSELNNLHHGHHYPLRLRQAMMELNRAISIDAPDLNLPWFHEKFCEEQLAINSAQETYLHKEVRTALANIVGDEASVQSNICSPYYYNLDFVIEFDERDRPIRKSARQPPTLFRKFKRSPESKVQRKVAVLLLSPNSFTKNIRRVKGPVKLRKRHLEILGYDVIEIDPRVWNSMYMSEISMRQHFLESKLYSSASAIG